jgi:hypothetical protein
MRKLGSTGRNTLFPRWRVGLVSDFLLPLIAWNFPRRIIASL